MESYEFLTFNCCANKTYENDILFFSTVPPAILEGDTSSDTVVEERSKVSLRCEASGYPIPTITWRREDGKDINLGSYGGRKYSG